MRNALARCIVAVTVSMLSATWGFCDGTQSAEVVSPPVRLPEVTVTGEQPLNEEQPLGENQQPEWTARRRFTTARVYVQPPWQVETETGWDATYGRTGIPHHLLTQEIELGLPYRFQADYEYAETVDGGHWRYDSSSFELRWALADWGKIPLNPTVKAEWKINNTEADTYELSLSVGDELAPRWHWGAEGFYEQQVGSDREREYAGALALSYTVIDEKLGVGIESKLSDEGDKDQHNPEISVIVGPSLQWRPTPRTHLDIAPLLGVTGLAPRIETFVFFGFDFGSGSERSESLAPASLRNK